MDIFLISTSNSRHYTQIINDDVKIVRTPKNMAASVVNLPGMTLQPPDIPTLTPQA